MNDLTTEIHLAKANFLSLCKWTIIICPANVFNALLHKTFPSAVLIHGLVDLLKEEDIGGE